MIQEAIASYTCRRWLAKTPTSQKISAGATKNLLTNKKNNGNRCPAVKCNILLYFHMGQRGLKETAQHPPTGRLILITTMRKTPATDHHRSCWWCCGEEGGLLVVANKVQTIGTKDSGYSNSFTHTLDSFISKAL